MAVALTLFVSALWSLASLLNWILVPCTLPAATFLPSAAMKSARGGGHEQGMLTTVLLAARNPSQDPACRAPGFVLAFTPKSGTRAVFMPPCVWFPPPDGVPEDEGDAADDLAGFAAAAFETEMESDTFVGRAATAGDEASNRMMVLKNFIVTGCGEIL